MRRIIIVAVLALACASAFAQSSPNLTYGQVPTAGQWNGYFAAKQDLLRFSPLNLAGGTMSGKLQTAPATINGAGFSILPGTSPTVPANGDLWVTTAGLFARVAGITVGPIGPSTVAVKGQGTSVADPGTGNLESLLTAQSITGVSYTYTTTDLFQKTRRSNSGSAMADTFPASTATGMVNGTRIVVANVDATASITITAGAGTTMPSGSTDTIAPGRDVAYEYDAAAATWRGAYNTRTALLTGNTGTAGHLIPYLDGTNTWSATQILPNNSLTFAELPMIAANTILGNFGSSAAPPAVQSVNGGASCATALIYTNGTGIGCAASSAGANIAPQGRLTLASATPVMTATVTAATSTYYTPYTGNVIGLWNGSSFAPTTFSEYTQALSDTTYSPSAAVAGACYDEFGWNSSGTVRVTRGPAWSAGTGGSNTQRGTGAGSTALTRVQGVLVNANAITNGPAAGFGTFVGTFCTDAGGATVTWNLGSSAAGGGVATLNLWNMYNRVSVTPTVQDSTASWTYATAAYRSADNSITNRINFVVGLTEDGVQASYSVEANITSGTAFGIVGVGLDKTNGYSGVPGIFGGAAIFAQPIAQYAGNLLGQHYLQAVEFGGTNITFFGNGTQLLTVTLRM